MTPEQFNLKLVDLKFKVDQISRELDNLILNHYHESQLSFDGPEGEDYHDGPKYMGLDPQYPTLQRRLLPDAISDLNNSQWDINDPTHYRRYQRLKGSIRNALILNKVDRMPFKDEPKWNIEMLKTINP